VTETTSAPVPLPDVRLLSQVSYVSSLKRGCIRPPGHYIRANIALAATTTGAIGHVATMARIAMPVCVGLADQERGFSQEPRFRKSLMGETMFITPAYAQAAGGTGLNAFETLLPILFILPIMYFLVLRPQQQKMKQHRDMIAKVARGDTVVTNGGIVGKVTRVKEGEGEIEVEIAENTRVRVVRGMIAEVRVKGQPVKEAEKA
jgi:preprotein translocase subunit YajC